MKKLTGILMVTGLLLLPLWANAAIIGNVELKVQYTAPNGNVKFPGERGLSNNPLDYEGSINGGAYSQIFCVENVAGPRAGVGTAYTLLDIDSSLTSYGVTTQMLDRYLKAAKVAQYYWTMYDDKNSLINSGNEEKWGAAAQIAIWEIMFDNSFALYDEYSGGEAVDGGSFRSEKGKTYTNDAKSIYYAAMAAQGLSTSEWVLAVNPVVSSAKGGSGLQNFLVHYQKPEPPTQTPEPASLLLFGFGLAGLAGIRRKVKK